MNMNEEEVGPPIEQFTEFYDYVFFSGYMKLSHSMVIRRIMQEIVDLIEKRRGE